MCKNMDNLLQRMEQFAQTNNVPIINEQGRKVFLDLIAEIQPSKVLEIGTAIGYSALLTCSQTKHPVEILSLELDPQRVEQAKDFIAQSPYAGQIEIRQGDAAQLLAQLPLAEDPEDKFDLVFMDAAKGQYPKYLELVLPHLSKQGVIIADNVLFRNYVLGNEEVPKRFRTIVKRLRQYIAMISDEEKFSSKIYHNGDGLAVTRLKGK